MSYFSSVILGSGPGHSSEYQAYVRRAPKYTTPRLHLSWTALYTSSPQTLSAPLILQGRNPKTMETIPPHLLADLPATPGQDCKAVEYLFLFGQESSPFLPSELGERKSDIKLEVYHSEFMNLRKDSHLSGEKKKTI